MWKINIKNQSRLDATGKKEGEWEAKFETELEADTWANEQKNEPYRSEIEAVYTKTDLNNDPEWQMIVGKKRARLDREACYKVLDHMAARNYMDLTDAQIDSMMADTDLAAVLQMLQAGRPQKARDLVNAYTPDGTLVTQALKDDVIAMLDARLAAR